MVDPTILELDKIEEENKASSQFAFYSKETNASPLIYNKGAPRNNSFSVLKCKSRKFTDIYEIKKIPENSLEKIDNPIIGEFNLADNNNSINKMLNVPTFEPQPIADMKEDTILIEDLTMNMPSKSASMAPPRHADIKYFNEDLSTTERNFYKKVHSCEDEYFNHVLNIPDVSLQYAIIMEEVCKHSSSNEIITQIKTLQGEAYKYPKLAKYKGKVIINDRS